MNACWHRRRTKQGLAARQFVRVQRKLRRLRAAKVPLPHSASSRGPGLVLTVTYSERD